MFSERFNQVMRLLGLTTKTLAEYSGHDPSNISRMRTGKRIPKVGGKSIRELSGAICRYADDTAQFKQLCALLDSPNISSGEELSYRLQAWLSEDIPRFKRPTASSVAGTLRSQLFGEKLNALFSISGLSNNRFSRLINMDASVVSRFRNGLRSPRENTKTALSICTVLLRYLREQGKLTELAELIGNAPTDFEDEEAWLPLLKNWLFDIKQGDDSQIVEKLLENIDAFSLEHQLPPPSLDEVLSLLPEERDAYFGINGLQTAVLRFLSDAIRRSTLETVELLLYSDQNMEWLVGDPAFRQQWAALMLACVSRGVRIRIIHNLDRDPGELIDAILSWLPLYLSGTIESFYCTKQPDQRFSHTLFLAPGRACITGFQVTGMEEQAAYHYLTDPALLEAAENSYHALLSQSKHLIRIYQNADAALPTVADSQVTVISNTLTLGTMPEDTLRILLANSQLSEEQRQSIYALWETKRQLFETNLEQGLFQELLPLAEPEKLYAGEVPVDLPDFFLPYTPGAYAEHTAHLRVLLTSCPRYRLCVLPNAPFPNTQIVIGQDQVKVIRMKAPAITFVLSHPSLRDAFLAYAARLRELYQDNRIDLSSQLADYFLL